MWTLKFFILIFLINHPCFAHECGVVRVAEGLITGGEYSRVGQWPWLASLFVKPYGYIGGASIISEEFLLGEFDGIRLKNIKLSEIFSYQFTAAHTVHPKNINKFPKADYHALLGHYNLSDTSNENSVRVEFLEIFMHPDWDPKSQRYDADIALFLTKSKIQFTAFIQPICLPTNEAKVFDVSGTVAGYGLSESESPHETLPKHVRIKSVNDSVCLYTDPSLALFGSLRMFCAGEKGKNSCKGDSGGPFMVEVNRKWTINGIVSATVAGRECHENDFVLFTQVPKFVEWIKKMIGNPVLEVGCYENFCTSYSFKILTPNRRISSILFKYNIRQNEIKKIKIWGAKVHYLPDFSIAKKKFPKFTKLTIESSGLKELDRSKLALLPQLTELDVWQNKIEELPENVFDDLINLEKLDIRYNEVKVLPQKLLWKLPKLKEFRADRNQIEAIPARFFEMNKNIEIIWMFGNKISRIQIDLRSLPKLKAFELNGNLCISKDFREDGGYEALTNKDELQRLINEKCR